MIRIVYASEEIKHYHNCITLVKYPATAFAWQKPKPPKKKREMAKTHISNLQTMLSLFD